MTTQTAPVVQNASATNAPAKDASSQFASLYVGDLSPEVTESVLYEIFNAVGPVASIRVCRDSITRRSLGYAYVNFSSVADAERALEVLNYSDIKGIPCRIMWSHRDPALRRSGASNVFVKNLDKSIDNRALYDTFSIFGNILSCKVSVDMEGKSRGFGFVHYDSEEPALQSITKLNGMQIGNKTVFVGFFHKNNERSKGDKPFTNIYVKHMPESWDEATLSEEFSKFGEVTSVLVRVDAKGRKSGFVNFKDFDEAKAAVHELHGRDFRTEEEKLKVLTDEEALALEEEKDDDVYPYQLYVVRAQPKGERQQELKQKHQASLSSSASSGSVGVGASQSGSAAASKFHNSNLYIKNLSETCDDEELEKMFEPFGTITSSKVMKDEKGVSRCFGFVSFTSPDEATKAVTEMHLKLVNGKPLYVGLHERKEQRMERLQQRYRVPNMMGAAGMMGPAGMMMQRPGVPGQFGGLYGSSAAATGPQMYYNAGIPRGPSMPGVMGQQQRMGPGANAPQLAYGQQQRLPGMSGSGGGYMMGNQMMMNPQQAAAMRAGMIPAGGAPQAKMMMMPGRGGPAGAAPAGMMRQGGGATGLPPGAMPMRPQPMMPGQQGVQRIPGANGGQYPYGAPSRPQQVHGGWPEQQHFDPNGPLTAAALAAAPPAMQKQMLGEKLFPLINKYQPELAGKITGMMLEMDNSELLILLESESQLKAKVDEALRVLQGQ